MEERDTVTFNYRVCKQENAEYPDEVFDNYSFREAHYRNGELIALSVNAIDLDGFTSVSGAAMFLEELIRATKKPVIDIDELPESFQLKRDYEL